MSRFVRDCKGYLDQSGDNCGETESLTVLLKFLCPFFFPAHLSNTSSLLLLL